MLIKVIVNVPEGTHCWANHGQTSCRLMNNEGRCTIFNRTLLTDSAGFIKTTECSQSKKQTKGVK